MLGEWGAEVIKVEPFDGDPQRGNTQPSYFELDNRGKRSLCLDLKSTRGNAILTQVLDGADVFVTNIRPGALARLGLDFETLAVRNPRLVYGMIGGYSATGPAADKPGYDVGAFWSRAGVAAAIVGPDAEPPVPRPGLGDHTTALALVAGIGAALVERGRTGLGGLVTTSLLRTGAFVISSDLSSQLAGSPPETGLRRAMYNPLLACYRTGDGKWFWLLGLQIGRHWPSVLRAVDRQDLLDDERFSSFGRIVRNSRDVIATLDLEFSKRTLEEWSEIFAREDVWWDPVQSPRRCRHRSRRARLGCHRRHRRRRSTVASPVSFGGFDPGPIERAPKPANTPRRSSSSSASSGPEIAELHAAGVIPSCTSIKPTRSGPRQCRSALPAAAESIVARSQSPARHHRTSSIAPASVEVHQTRASPTACQQDAPRRAHATGPRDRTRPWRPRRWPRRSSRRPMSGVPEARPRLAVLEHELLGGCWSTRRRRAWWRCHRCRGRPPTHHRAPAGPSPRSTARRHCRLRRRQSPAHPSPSAGDRCRSRGHGRSSARSTGSRRTGRRGRRRRARYRHDAWPPNRQWQAPAIRATHRARRPATSRGPW